jgi:hypothetical protein
MKIKKANLLFLLLALGLIACNQPKKSFVNDAVPQKTDSVVAIKTENKEATPINKNVYCNARFKDVTVEKIGKYQYIIKGKAQIFEANFSWIIEDGHNELQKGHQMTDAGAPEWGNFNFSVEVQKNSENSTLHLILFESSAKDGSRQHELPVLLE